MSAWADKLQPGQPVRLPQQSWGVCMPDLAPSLDVAAVEQWLYLLHGDCPGFSVVSSTLNWAGRAFEVSVDSWPDEVVRHITLLDRQRAKGTYLRVTTVADRPENGQRGGDEHSIALPALWLDMDIAGPGHKPIRPTPSHPSPLPLPPDDETCQRIVQHAGLPEPTLWVHSGGGLYPWFFFKNPVKLLTPDDIEEWSDHSARLHDTVAAAAADLGWHYGTGTHDMSRVMRIPGTVNRKVDGAPTQARFYDFPNSSGQTFMPQDLHLPPLVDQAPIAVPPTRPTITVSTAQPGLRPGEDYNQRGDVLYDVLLPAGWDVHSMQRGGEIYLTRPGKDRKDGHSASLYYQGSRNLYVWSSDAGVDTDTPLSPFHLYAFYRWAGDYRAAAKDLAAQGYGDPLPASTLLPTAPLTAAPALASTRATEPPSTSSGGGDEPPGEPPFLGDGDGEDDGVRFIDVTKEDRAVPTLRGILGTGAVANMHSYAGSMISLDGMTGPRRDENKPLYWEVSGTHAVRAMLMKATEGRIVKQDKDGHYKSAQISVNTAAAVASSWHEAPNLRVLRGIFRTPVIRPDGTIWDTRGYDPVTQMAYIPDPELTIPTVPTAPSKDDLERARKIIEYVITDFPWVSDNDKMNYIGMMLTPMLTSVVTTPIKLGVISAHQPGSGKTLLANLLTRIHGGTTMPAFKTGTEEEIRKLITSSLKMSGFPVAVWDNVRGDLDSTTLDALLTTRSWTDRILGKNQTVTMPNDKMWVITGNNVQLGSDLTRRAVWAAINPNMPHPERRNNFRENNLEGWVTENRGHVLWALYTMIQAWSVAGKPTYCTQTDLFCGWVGTVNGILRVAGFDGEFDAAASRRQTESTTTAEWTPLFEEILERFGEDEWTVADLMNLISPNSTVSQARPWTMDVLPVDLLAPFQSGSTAMVGRSMGLRLKSIMGRYIDGVKVVQNPQRSRFGYRWHLERYVPPVTSENGQDPSSVPQSDPVAGDTEVLPPPEMWPALQPWILDPRVPASPSPGTDTVPETSEVDLSHGYQPPMGQPSGDDPHPDISPPDLGEEHPVPR